MGNAAHPGLLLRFGLRRYEFQKVANLAIQNGANPCKNINVQSSDVIVSVVIDLGTLHFGPVAEFVLADAGFFDQLVQSDSDGSVLFHCFSSVLVEKC